MKKIYLIYPFLIIYFLFALTSHLISNNNQKSKQLTYLPPPENFTANDGYLFIDLEWDPPQADFNIKNMLEPVLQGYTLYRDDIGFMYYFNDPNIDSYTDRMVECWGVYTYTLYALYDLGVSSPVSDTATAYPPTGGYYETFNSDWATTGWTILGHPNNWLWSPGHAYLYWSPTVEDYDMSLISPCITLLYDPQNVGDMTIKMFIDDYTSDTGEVMEIWVIHDTGEDMIFEWDLDNNDDWGISGGTDWIYENMSQYAGQTVQLKFRSHGGSTYHFNYWYIYEIINSWSWSPPVYGALEGTVTDYDGNPIQYVRVSIAGCTVYTDENGHYLASPVEAGIWNVQFYHEDYTELIYDDVEICEDQTTVLDAMLGNPTMEIYPNSLEVMIPPFDSTSIIVTVTNNGTNNLDWYLGNFGKREYRDDNQCKNKNYLFDLKRESNHRINTVFPPPSDDMWDIIFSYDVDSLTGGVGMVGAEFGNEYFLVSEWGYSTRKVYKFNYDGTYVGSWEPTWMPGTGGIRDMAFDGEYFYGSNAGNTIYQFDEHGNLYGTINSPVTVRAIAYDEINDAFWVNNWVEDLKLIDRSGIVLNTISSPPSMYGCAYDNVSDGGPYLWIFTGTTTGGGCQIEQYDLNTLTLTGVTHGVDDDFGIASYISGGLFTSVEIVPGKWILGGVARGNPNILFGYEICPYPYNPLSFVTLEPLSGTVNPYGGTQQLTATFYSENDPPGTFYSGEVVFRSHQNIPPVTVPISLMIINPEYGALVGTISHGYPIEDAEIHAYNGSYSYTTYTNSSGFYNIEDMAVGNYTVEISIVGYNPYSIPNVPIIADQVTTLNIALTAPIMVVAPLVIYSTPPPGVVTFEYFTIANTGDGPLEVEIEVYDYGKQITDYSNCSENAVVCIHNKEQHQNKAHNTRAEKAFNEIILHYDGDNLTGAGLSSGGTFMVASRFTPDELNIYYEDYSISGVQLFIYDTFDSLTLKIWEDGSIGDPGFEIYSQEVTSQAVFGWNQFDLLSAVSLQSSKEYWIGFEVKNSLNEFPIGIDTGPSVVTKGDWIYLNGEWDQFSIYGYDNNWNIRMIIEEGNPPWISVGQSTGTISPGCFLDVAIEISTLYLNLHDVKTADIVISTNPDVGVVTIPVTLVVSDISQDEPQITETDLHPNFPNPVLNNTTFEFSLKEPSHVTLSVYNLKGQLVATLLDEELEPTASHCIEWDGTANGKKLANGIYFYKLETSTKSFLKKMVLMR
jgi:hypothetical protein